MKSILMMALVGLVSAGSGAFAQNQNEQAAQTVQSDASSDSTGNKNETLKQCMARQKASNSGVTQLQMETTCKNEMKGDKLHKDGNDLASGPQAESQPQKDQH